MPVYALVPYRPTLASQFKCCQHESCKLSRLLNWLYYSSVASSYGACSSPFCFVSAVHEYGRYQLYGVADDFFLAKSRVTQV